MNTELDICEVECGACGGFPAHSFSDDHEPPCDICHSTGKITVHDWKRIGATSQGVSLVQCARCGEAEPSD